MSDKNQKELRKQLRNIVKEVLPEVLTQELVSKLFSEIRAMVTKRLDEIDKRQKDIQGYMVRQSARGVKTEAPKQD